jgi:hypothetical protein
LAKGLRLSFPPATTAALQAAPAGFGNPVLLLPSLAETSSTGALGNAFTGIT